MKIFSTRYSKTSELRHLSFSVRRAVDDRSRTKLSNTLFDPRLRRRICYELKHVLSSYNYLEPFLLVRNTNKDKATPNIANIKDFSLAGAGYDVTENLDPVTMEVSKYDDDGTPFHNDIALMDLLEIVMIFCKETERSSLADRFNEIFKEQSAALRIRDWMVTISGGEMLSSLVPLIKDETLRNKLETDRGLRMEPMTAQARASNAAGVLQFIFSGDGKSDTQKASEDIVKNISAQWTDGDSVEKLNKILNKLVLLTKEMNNEISNIRHTDKNKIKTDGESMFEMITRVNLAIIRLSIISDPAKYIENRKASDIKNDYATRYNKAIDQYTDKDYDDEDDDEIPFDISRIPF